MEKLVPESLNELLNEDYKSFSDLTLLVKKEMNNYLKQHTNKLAPIWKIFDKDIKEEDEMQPDEFMNYIIPFNKTVKYPSKYKSLEKFINIGIGLIYGTINKDPHFIQGAFMSPEFLKGLMKEDYPENYKKLIKQYPYGIIVFPLMTILQHELQHLYDFWRSGGKAMDNYKTKKYKRKDVKKKGFIDPAHADYYLLEPELSAYFNQEIESHYWTDFQGNFSPWEIQSRWFKNRFEPWEYLNDKGRKKYINKFYIYYKKAEEIFDKEGVKGLKAHGLEVR